MYKFLTRYRSSQSGLFIAAVVAGCLSCSLTNAQTRVFTDQFGNPTVSIDYTVLDRLGPPPSLPELYRRTAPAPERLVRGNRLPAPTRGIGYLAKPPRQMPRSTLNLPNSIKPSRADRFANTRGIPSRQIMPETLSPTRAVQPPPPASITQENRPTQSKDPVPRVKSQAVKPRVVPKSKLTLPSASPSRLAAAPKVNVVKRSNPRPATKPASAPRKLTPIEPPKALPKPVITATKAAAAPRSVPPPATPVIAPTVGAPKPETRVASATAPTSSNFSGTVAVSADGNLLSIPFAVAKTDLPPSALPALDKLANRMNTNDDIRIQLMGFANGKNGSGSRARRNSLFRALSVRNYLMKQGVRTTRMDVRALGQNSIEGVPPDRVDIVVQP